MTGGRFEIKENWGGWNGPGMSDTEIAEREAFRRGRRKLGRAARQGTAKSHMLRQFAMTSGGDVNFVEAIDNGMYLEGISTKGEPERLLFWVDEEGVWRVPPGVSIDDMDFRGGVGRIANRGKRDVRK